jgi:methylglutaconyl-CoA hydratase
VSDAKVILSVEDQIATISLNNPERYNALSLAVIDGLHDMAARLSVSADVRAVIIHGGESKAFCSGADLKERQGMPDDRVFATVHKLRETFNLIERLPMPTIAAIHGMAFGGGCELALACDLRILSEEAQIGLTEVKWAIVPGGGGTQRLPAIVGLAKAKELIFTALPVGAVDAERIGLANRVVARERLLEEALSVAREIARNGPLAVRAAKRALQAAADLPAGLAAEWEAYQTIIRTKDRQEGLRAFAEKRAPQYTGE